MTQMSYVGACNNNKSTTNSQLTPTSRASLRCCKYNAKWEEINKPLNLYGQTAIQIAGPTHCLCNRVPRVKGTMALTWRQRPGSVGLVVRAFTSFWSVLGSCCDLDGSIINRRNLSPFTGVLSGGSSPRGWTKLDVWTSRAVPPSHGVKRRSIVFFFKDCRDPYLKRSSTDLGVLLRIIYQHQLHRNRKRDNGWVGTGLNWNYVSGTGWNFQPQGGQTVEFLFIAECTTQTPRKRKPRVYECVFCSAKYISCNVTF